MRILYVTDLVLDNRRAPTIHVDAICRNFAVLGHGVTLYAPSVGELRADVYRIVRIWAPRFLLSIFYQPQLLFRLLGDLMKIDEIRGAGKAAPEAYNLYGEGDTGIPQRSSSRFSLNTILYVRHSHLLVVPALLGWFFRIQVFLEVNSILEQDARHINHTWLSRILLASGIFAFLERLNARLATKIIAVTPGIKDYFTAHYDVSDKIAVVPNGVDTDFFKPLQHTNDILTIGYIGSLHAWQGVKYIVEAANKLPQYRFVIIGGGEEQPPCESYIREHNLTNVELRPSITHDKVPEAINSFDICISYPLKFRDGATSPFKIYEYLACGKPVVSSDLKSMREEFGDILAYAEAENAESLARTLKKLIDNPAARSAAGEAGRAFVENGRSWKSVAGKIIALYAVIEQPNR